MTKVIAWTSGHATLSVTPSVGLVPGTLGVAGSHQGGEVRTLCPRVHGRAVWRRRWKSAVWTRARAQGSRRGWWPGQRSRGVSRRSRPPRRALLTQGHLETGTEKEKGIQKKRNSLSSPNTSFLRCKWMTGWWPPTLGTRLRDTARHCAVTLRRTWAPRPSPGSNTAASPPRGSALPARGREPLGEGLFREGHQLPDSRHGHSDLQVPTLPY